MSSVLTWIAAVLLSYNDIMYNDMYLCNPYCWMKTAVAVS